MKDSINSHVDRELNIDKAKGINTILEMVNKYNDIFVDFRLKSKIPYIARIIEYCVSYLGDIKYTDWNYWYISTTISLYLRGKIIYFIDVNNTIDELKNLVENEYDEYKSKLLSDNENHIQSRFITKYINEKI